MKRLALGIKRAGKVIGLKRSSIYALLKKGRLRAVKVGSRTLITVESLEELIARSAVEFPNPGKKSAKRSKKANASASTVRLVRECD